MLFTLLYKIDVKQTRDFVKIYNACVRNMVSPICFPEFPRKTIITFNLRLLQRLASNRLKEKESIADNFFKTIRFQKGDWSVQEASNFLREYFPCSRVVANIRSDVESQLKSMSNTFKNDHKGADDTDKILKMNDFLIRVAEVKGGLV